MFKMSWLEDEGSRIRLGYNDWFYFFIWKLNNNVILISYLNYDFNVISYLNKLFFNLLIFNLLI